MSAIIFTAMPEPEFQPGPPLNYLVYGPPGTGKRTYASQLAVSLADQVPLDEVQKLSHAQLYERYHLLVNEGQLVFLAMHAGWSYENMVERCLFEQENVIVHDGILKQLATEARGNLIEHLLQVQPDVLPNTDFKDVFSGFLQHLKGQEQAVVQLPDQEPFLIHSILKNGDILLRRPKTFQVIRVKRSIIRRLFTSVQKARDPQKLAARLDELLAGENIPAFEAVWAQFSSFQQAYAEAMRPVVPEPSLADPYREVQMDLLPDGVLQSSKKYVLILEHIHLVDPNDLFGDALTMLDSRRREGCRCAQSVLLPGSKTPFTLPPNLFIIAIAPHIPAWSTDLAFLMNKTFYFIPVQSNERDQDWPVIRSIRTKDFWQAINKVIHRHADQTLSYPGAAFQDCHHLKGLKSLLSSRILPYLQWVALVRDLDLSVLYRDLFGSHADSLNRLDQWKTDDFQAILSLHDEEG